MKKTETVPDHLLVPDRRGSKRERRLRNERRESIRWELDKSDRRQMRQDRRKSVRSPWDGRHRPP